MKLLSTLAAIAVFTFSSISFASPVNINTASASEISEALNGIGMVKAQAIVDFRTTNGLFSSADQITMVNGIGDSTYEKNKADILLK
ncbi:MAG: ComEA family DNA-binding protein [Gammaproteobacteria bacterium]|nr:ComEA family DNA-binding protein [Gammaproteobacteria bacterium]